MPVSATQLLTSGSATDATSYTTASISPSANKLVLFAVGNDGTSTLPTISGGGMTWTQVNTFESGGRRITLWRALMTSTPTPAAVVIDFGVSTCGACNWSVTEFFDVPLTGSNGADAVVQSVTNTGSAVTSLTVTLGAFGDANNATYGAIMKNGTEVITQGSGFTELGENNAQSSIEAEWKNSNDTSVDWSWATNHEVRGIAVEIKYQLFVPRNGNFLAFL